MALDANGNELHDHVDTIEGEVIRVMAPREAISRGMLSTEEEPVFGTQYTLPLHPLGTDYLGRDMLARLMHGARVSLFIGFFAPFIFVLIGVAYGSVAGFLGGMTDQVLMRFADFVVCTAFPVVHDFIQGGFLPLDLVKAASCPCCWPWSCCCGHLPPVWYVVRYCRSVRKAISVHRACWVQKQTIWFYAI